MSDQLEQLLRETFDEDARGAPPVGTLAARARETSRRRRRARAGSVLGASLTVAALVAAVALGDTTRGGAAPPAGPVAVDWPDCEATGNSGLTAAGGGASQHPAQLAPYSVPMGVVLCVKRFEPREEDGMLVGVMDQSRGTAVRGTAEAPLLAAIRGERGPGSSPSPGAYCPTTGRFAWILLVGPDGSWVQAPATTDVCGEFSPALTRALAVAGLELVSSRRLPLPEPGPTMTPSLMPSAS